MAADPAELGALTRKLRGKGLSDAQVLESLKGLGFTKAQAQAAVSEGRPPEPKPAPAAPPKARDTGGVPPQPAGVPVPQLAAPDLSKLSLTPPKRIKSGDVGGFVAGLVLYTLALNFLRYGKPGVSGWLRAKFLNQTNDVGTQASTGIPGRRGAKGDPLVDPTSSTGLTSTRAQVT